MSGEGVKGLNSVHKSNVSYLKDGGCIMESWQCGSM